MPPAAHLLTIDLEDWYHANLMDGKVDRARAESRVEASTRRLLDLLEEAGARATVFVLGAVAERHPQLVRTVRERGHEIASHGYAHRLAYQQSPAEFEEDLGRSVECIEAASGVRPAGYRAPSWSITRRNLWALEIVRRAGFAYDSSIFPFRTFLYGIPGAPNRPFRIRLSQGELLEIPASTLTLGGVALPFSGGAYFRLLPAPLARAGFRSVARGGHPAMFYTHPWELDADCPRVKGLGAAAWLMHYAGAGRMPGKIRRLLGQFRFLPLAEYLAQVGRGELPEVRSAEL
ncbi:MAG TPA: XrtA system polysaccharide deacetylase [Bryobacteraceae bacterium]|nr:XrtA system polysaccharide deacetylase [Bryobacteraceae bacterium]